MATSTIKLYKVDFNEADNCKIDDFSNYLASNIQEAVNNFQYVKNQLNVNIKLNLEQVEVNYSSYNYVSIKNSDDINTFYYFINNLKWIAQNTVQLELKLDTINTFWDLLDWKNSTHITRQHKDRFSESASSNTYLRRIVDKEDEGISAPKYLSTQTNVRYVDNSNHVIDNDWYLIYKTERPLTENDLNNPLHCYLCANSRLLVEESTTLGNMSYSSFTGTEVRYITKLDNPQFNAVTSNGNTLNWNVTFQQVNWKPEAYLLIRNGSSLKIEYIYYNTSSGTYGHDVAVSSCTAVTFTRNSIYRNNFNGPVYNLTNIMLLLSTDYYINSGGTYCKSIDDIDRTDSSIMKIVLLPYCPVNVSIIGNTYYINPNDFHFNYDKGLYEVSNLNAEFLSNVANKESTADYLQLDRSRVVAGIDKDIDFESKLYNSNFFTLKYQYDEQSKEFMLERFAVSNNYLLSGSRFKPSNNINSKFIFNLSSPDYQEIDYKGEYLLIDRDNSLAQYNNDYLNYMRNGYSYDKEKKNRDVAAGMFNITKAGIIGSLTKGTPWGVVSSVAQSTSQLVFNAIDAEQNIQRKRQELSVQAGSITNSDVDLLKYTTNNRLQKLTYKASDNMRNALFNMFHLTGYTCNEYGIPEFNSRIYFNFIQCEPEFDVSNWTSKVDYLNDIEQRFKAGVTVFHKYNNTYDFHKEKENFESWLFN